MKEKVILKTPWARSPDQKRASLEILLGYLKKVIGYDEPVLKRVEAWELPHALADYDAGRFHLLRLSNG